MHVTDTFAWIRQSERRVQLLLNWDQPLTCAQLARRVGLDVDACRKVIRWFARYRVACCLNPAAKSSRVYYLTLSGLACQKQAFVETGQPRPAAFQPALDWALYGSVCFRHRRAVLKALVKPMSPAQIKRWASGRDGRLRISANNVRDVVRFFAKRGIVEPVYERRTARPRYQLTKDGQLMREMICRAEGGAWPRCRDSGTPTGVQERSSSGRASQPNSS